MRVSLAVAFAPSSSSSSTFSNIGGGSFSAATTYFDTYYDSAATPTDTAAALAVSAQVTEAATQLTLILQAQSSIDVATAQSSANFISTLLQQEVAADNQVQEQSSEQILSAVIQLSRAVTATAQGEVRLETATLNMTTEARSLEELFMRSVVADTLGGREQAEVRDQHRRAAN